MKKARVLDWESYFMGTAIFSSLRSKDPLVQNGACIVDDHKRIVGVGYNGLPRGLDDSVEQYWMDDDNDPLHSRHTYVVHAERNAIYNALGRSVEGSSLYCTQFPCANCAQTIIQTGIKKVCYLGIKAHHKPINDAVMKMFHDAGVSFEQFDMSHDKEGIVADILQTKSRIAK